MKYYDDDNTICAISTGNQMSAISVIRVSGNKSIEICNSIFSKDILSSKSHTIKYGNIHDNGKIIDEVIVSIFRDGKSFTGEDSVEISCHGSTYIQNKIIQKLIDSGCRTSAPGEFTMRAFKNGKIDLSQAESIADLIQSKNKESHQAALNQLKGGFSKKLNELRKKLIDFASLIELELDFSEEDVEFANRLDLIKLLEKIITELKKLIESFTLGNVIKNGVPVTILGPPNSGKSTLLNTLLNEDKSIVSKIEGTTRDAIEDNLNINGYNFRFIDTAGIRSTNDSIEIIGIKKSYEKAKSSKIILFIIDSTKKIDPQIKEYLRIEKLYPKKIIPVLNKIDIKKLNLEIKNLIQISAKEDIGITKLKESLVIFMNLYKVQSDDNIVTNTRHYEELSLCLIEVEQILNGIRTDVSTEFLSVNIRKSLFHLGSITGEITTDTLLSNIFEKFCIGK